MLEAIANNLNFTAIDPKKQSFQEKEEEKILKLPIIPQKLKFRQTDLMNL